MAGGKETVDSETLGVGVICIAELVDWDNWQPILEHLALSNDESVPTLIVETERSVSERLISLFIFLDKSILTHAYVTKVNDYEKVEAPKYSIT